MRMNSLIATVALALTAVMTGRVEGQVLKRFVDKVKDRVESRTDDLMDRLVNKGEDLVECAAADAECINAAEGSGKTVVLTDNDGKALPEAQQPAKTREAAGAAGDTAKVAVYPGARPDAATTATLREGIHLDAACYRTDDAVTKVVDFYRQRPVLDVVHVDKQGGLVKRCKKEFNEYLKKEMSVDCDVEIHIENPWHAADGKEMHDTLICIANTSNDTTQK
jgi:hypothetical protein